MLRAGLCRADSARPNRGYDDHRESPRRHAAQADEGVRRRPIIREKNIGSAIIIQSAVVRGGYTALRWISPQPAPNRAFPNLREAAEWCVHGIEADGQIVPIAAYKLAGLAAHATAG